MDFMMQVRRFMARVFIYILLIMQGAKRQIFFVQESVATPLKQYLYHN
jgi:hypothetical protein